jgi:copper chaperone NosL
MQGPARRNRFLDQTIDARTRLMVLVAAALLLATYFLPLWNLTMFAPQYPDGLRLDIYSYTLVGGNNGQDITEINVLNHYIGMRDLVNEEFTEFQWMPFVIGALGLLMLRAVVHATVAALVDVTMLFVYFGAFSLWSFGYKLYRYGHDLSPTAAVQVPPFMPPMFGGQQIANFEVYSYPRAASYAMAGTIVLLLAALAWTWWQARRAAPRDAIAGPAAS